MSCFIDNTVVALSHHGFGLAAILWGVVTLATGIILLVPPTILRRYMHYVRFIHLISALISGTFGLIAYLLMVL